MVKNKRRVGRPEGSNRQQTEQTLLISAKKCFAEKGYDATTFKDIALDAGMTPAAIYQYFDSKMSLYSATLDKTLELILPQFFEAIEEKDSLVQKIETLLNAACDFLKDDKITTLFVTALPLELKRHPDLYDYLGFDSSGIVASIISLFEEAREQGEIPKDINSEGLMMTIMGGMMGITLFQEGFNAGSAQTGIQTLMQLIKASLIK